MKKSAVLYVYTMTSDSGFAPCVTKNFLTLACCKGGKKGGLRKSAGEAKLAGQDVWILGLCGKSLNINTAYKPIYLAQVTKVLRMAKYFGSELAISRVDDVYRYDEFGFAYPVNGNPHDVEEQEKDIGGIYVLVSDKFTYFGDECIKCTEIEKVFPDIFYGIKDEDGNIKKQGIISAPRSNHVYTNCDDFIIRIKEFGWFLNKPNIIGNPHTTQHQNDTEKNDEVENIVHSQKLCGSCSK